MRPYVCDASDGVHEMPAGIVCHISICHSVVYNLAHNIMLRYVILHAM